MRISNMWFDGGSFLLCIFFLVGALGPLIDSWYRNKPFPQSYWFLGISLLLAIFFLWLSVRIGGNRKKLRDTNRWMGENSDKTSVN